MNHVEAQVINSKILDIVEALGAEVNREKNSATYNGYTLFATSGRVNIDAQYPEKSVSLVLFKRKLYCVKMSDYLEYNDIKSTPSWINKQKYNGEPSQRLIDRIGFNASYFFAVLK